MTDAIIKVRRGLFSNLPAPTVDRVGEFRYCTDTKELYIVAPTGDIETPYENKLIGLDPTSVERVIYLDENTAITGVNIVNAINATRFANNTSYFLNTVNEGKGIITLEDNIIKGVMINHENAPSMYYFITTKQSTTPINKQSVLVNLSASNNQLLTYTINGTLGISLDTTTLLNNINVPTVGAVLYYLNNTLLPQVQSLINAEAATRAAADITLQNNINLKQDILIAGNNIQIAADGKTISATDTTYTAGNGLTLTGTEFSANVINTTSSTSTTDALSANMGKELQDEIDNLKARGRFLSLWNATTGLPETEPTTLPYPYKAGDYYIIGVVASSGGTNYKPDGTSYTGAASTVIETEEISTEDVYYFDGTVWHLQINTKKTVTFANLAGSPYDNTNLATALNAKQDTLTAGTNISIDENNVISNTQVVGDGTLTIKKNGVTIATFSANQTGNTTANILADVVKTDDITVSKNSDDELQAIGVIDKNSGVGLYDWKGTLAEYNALPTRYNDWLYYITDDNTGGDTVYTKTEVDALLLLKQNKLTAGTNITIDENNVISATGEVYSAGEGINISVNNEISTENIVWRVW